MQNETCDQTPEDGWSERLFGKWVRPKKPEAKTNYGATAGSSRLATVDESSSLHVPNDPQGESADKASPYEAIPSVAIPGTTEAKYLADLDAFMELRTLHVLIITAVLWLSVGVIYMMAIEDFEFVEALYISVQLITTVGYGDFLVRPQMEIFMSFYLLGCIIWVGFALSNFVEAIQDMSAEFLRIKMKVAEKRMGYAQSDDQATFMFGRFNDLVVATIFFAVMLAIGSVFFRLLEHCSCMDSINQPIPGCRVGPSCGATGGRVLTWRSSFYLSVVTLTTCGFGDLHPSSKIGMGFACVWITVGVTSTANFIRAFCSYFFVFWRKHYVLTDKIVGDVFDEIDAEHDGKITRNDYKLYLIKRFKLVDTSILDLMDKQFDLFDKDSREVGIVSYRTMEEIYMKCDADVCTLPGKQTCGSDALFRNQTVP